LVAAELMNAHQRRATRRYWKYIVTLDIDPSYENIGVDLMVYDAVTWLEQNMGRKGKLWSHLPYHDRWTFYFHDSKDAAFFSLKWS